MAISGLKYNTDKKQRQSSICTMGPVFVLKSDSEASLLLFIQLLPVYSLFK